MTRTGSTTPSFQILVEWWSTYYKLADTDTSCITGSNQTMNHDVLMHSPVLFAIHAILPQIYKCLVP